MDVRLERDLRTANEIPIAGISSPREESKASGAIKRIERKLYFQSFFKGEEVGLTHPSYDSNIKLTNVGDIDIFTENNTGISIDRRLQVINMFANEIKEHIDNRSSWLTGDSKEYIRGNKETNVIGDVIMSADGSLILRISSALIEAKNITMNINGDTKIITTGKIDIEAKGHAKIKSEERIILASNQIDVEKEVVEKWTNKIKELAREEIMIERSKENENGLSNNE